jgi:hypothetical protein
MSFITSELDQAQSDLKRQGRDISMFRRFGEIIPQVSEQELEATIAEFHNMAGRYDFWADRDVGALILEHAADSMPSCPRRAALYRHAKYLAEWCAAASTAGGEGMARSRHVEQLAQKLSAEPDAPPNSRPPQQLPASPDIQTPDSQRASSSSGCG